MNNAHLEAFRIPWSEHLLSSLLYAIRPSWRRLGDLESSVLREQLEGVPISRPIYIAGLARSGSTILLEMLAAHPDAATHQYRDFWSIFTPVWAAQASQRVRTRKTEPRERSHGDGIMITPESPEAMEEMLWMEFFPQAHDPRTSQVLGAQTCHPNFETYYRDHLRKLLWVRGKPRYVSKANYNLTRLEFLHSLFPDARFVLPIREPRQHIASLQKQHQLLTQAARYHPRSVKYLERVGHFEFGARRIPINAGDTPVIESILNLWQHGEEVRGWARYWAHLYGFLAERLEANAELRSASIVVHYGRLCDRSPEVLEQLFTHCELPHAEKVIRKYADALQRPDYYRTHFSDADLSAIEEETQAVWARFQKLSGKPKSIDELATMPFALQIPTDPAGCPSGAR